MLELVEHDVSDLAAQTIGVAGSESRDRPAEDADLGGKHSAGPPSPFRQRHTAVQAEQLPPVGRLVLDDDRNVSDRRTEFGRQRAQRLVNRLFERIVGTRVPARIHLRNDATIGAQTEATSSNPDAVAVVDPFHAVALARTKLDLIRQRIHQQTPGRRAYNEDPL
jgi:Transposase